MDGRVTPPKRVTSPTWVRNFKLMTGSVLKQGPVSRKDEGVG